MSWIQKEIKLKAFPRGCHLITGVIEEQLSDIGQTDQGLLHLFLLHTSASLTISEAADPDVRQDLEMALSRIAPESLPYLHDSEGPDDMPAHVKSVLVGFDLTIPVHKGRLALGTWQGVYLWEHRDKAAPRRLMATLMRPHARASEGS